MENHEAAVFFENSWRETRNWTIKAGDPREVNQARVIIVSIIEGQSFSPVASRPIDTGSESLASLLPAPAPSPNSTGANLSKFRMRRGPPRIRNEYVAPLAFHHYASRTIMTNRLECFAIGARQTVSLATRTDRPSETGKNENPPIVNFDSPFRSLSIPLCTVPITGEYRRILVATNVVEPSTLLRPSISLEGNRTTTSPCIENSRSAPIRGFFWWMEEYRSYECRWTVLTVGYAPDFSRGGSNDNV